MYREQTLQTQKRKRRRYFIDILVICLLMAVCLFAYRFINANMREQGAASMREAILESAMQCCAIEGSYPSSLAYLEKEYGLVINHNDYVITYEAFAGNVMPSVVVVPR